MRKPIPKKIRDSVKARFGGRCGYCGEMVEKICIDHVYPVAQEHRLKIENLSFEDINDERNLMPACFSCNNYKMSMSLEQFRLSLQGQVSAARRYSVNFRLAERFKQIEITKHPIKFYFEKVK